MVDLVVVGVVVILAGFLVLFLATLFGRSDRPGEEKGTELKGGGVVLIGPIPIIFGSDAKWASLAAVLAIVLIVLSLFVIFYGGR